jgi:DNA repair exonuclease SbcCD ATPase subunit
MADDNSNNESSGVSEEQQKANLEKITAEIEKLEKIREKSENRRILAEAGISEELVNQLRLQQEQVEKKIKQSALSKELSKEQAELLAKELLIEQKKEEAIKKQIEAQKKSLDIQEKAADETKRQLDEFAELTLGIRDYSDQLDAIGKNTGDMLKGLTKGVAKFGKNLVFNFGVSQLKAQFEAFQNLRKEMDQASDMLGKATNAGVKWNNTLDRAFDSQKKLGISMMEVADSLTAITTTTPEFKKLRDTNASLATQVGGTSVLMTKLGASAQEAGLIKRSQAVWALKKLHAKANKQ